MPKKPKGPKDNAVTNIWEFLYRIVVEKPIYGFLIVISVLLIILFASYRNTPDGENVQLFGMDLFIKHSISSQSIKSTPEPNNDEKPNLNRNNPKKMIGISLINFIVVNKPQNAGPEEGWRWDNKDLNAETKKKGDPYIYITWKPFETLDVASLITSLEIYRSKDSKQAQSRLQKEGYILINKDLNKGAGGDFIYAGYKRGEDKKKPITDLRVTYGNDRSPEKDGFSRINVDLNSGAGGKFTYLWYSRK